MDWSGIALNVSIWVLPVLIAVIFHEVAHGWVAWRLGDDTANRSGRLSLNPLRHIDPFGTLLLPGLMLLASGGQLVFGFAKPVPVNFSALNNPRRDMVLVALAGPGMNFFLALLSGAAIHFLALLQGDLLQWVGYNLVNSIRINLLLCVFNLLPIPPLDGGRVAVGLLPGVLGRRLARLERLGVVIILFGVFILPWIGGKVGVNLNVFHWLIGLPTEQLMQTILIVTGHGS
jgi:Zn-dependent protease